MRSRVKKAAVAAAIVAGTAAAAAGATGASVPAGPRLTPVAGANPRSAGYAPASRLSRELAQTVVAQGATKIENPSALTAYFGYDNDVLNDQGQPVMVPAGAAGEAQKTEPDKNTYLVFDNGLPGADPAYAYGTRFLFQGHEAGAKDANGAAQGYITRINLDADSDHRVTLIATRDDQGKPIPPVDGSTWDPWARRLLFTAEGGRNGGVWATDVVPGSIAQDVSGALGRGGYEGIQNDAAGNLWLVEDVGGAPKKDASGTATAAKRPNSFVYRYVPAVPGDLHNGRLQALQVLRDGAPITYESQAALNAADQVALHTYGKAFATRWVTIHDTATDGDAPFDANAAAKAAHATPLKRPENGQFRPGSRFTEFYFDETGDTNTTSPENATAGGWGSVLRLVQSGPAADTGTLSMFYAGDEAHSGLDNVTFLSRDTVTFVEDAGDTLHAQRNALDSGFVWDVTVDYSDPANQPVRWLAEGRDPSATIDAGNGGFGKNDGDNEITGVHVSDGDPGTGGILGAKVPQLFANPAWRWFYTQQHGDNSTFEVARR
ncbi:MAG TPA: hypothetical protein VHN98_09460 [Acidimicrobiales bacterium]|nr:hypothetical protein [Acidimicrobiales bacterium]